MNTYVHTEDDSCAGCERLEQGIKRLEDSYQELLDENRALKDELAELRWMMEGLEK